MHADYSLVLILLFLDCTINAFIKLGVRDLGFVQYCTMLSFGTNHQPQQLDVSLNTPEISVLDADCTNTYGKCHKFCQNDEFCHLFCSPLCCVNPETRSLQCAGSRASDYLHNSTSFKALTEYWTSSVDHALGVWVEDEIYVDSVDTLDQSSIGVARFALKVVNSLYLDPDAIRRGDLGFGRHPNINNVVQVLYNKGAIERPLLTIAYYLRYSPYYVLGEHSESYCTAEEHKVQALGNREWMFDAISAMFLNFKSHRRKFRIILSSNGVIGMPRHVLLTLLENDVISAYLKQQNFYFLNRESDNYSFTFTSSSNFTLYSNLRSVDVSYHLYPPSNGVVFPASSVDPNPDGVEWIVGRMIYINYCASFDYDDNTISFSKLSPSKGVETESKKDTKVTYLDVR